MYLKAVEIIGFKSFAEKVRMSFEKGITCVVGPNGCGKSNVVDSIRWCIGEKSWKQLRSPSMIDIIFNGTAKRSPLNLAEVNMVFDNTSRRLPIDFSEVTVTRRIYRTGESEYYLNKVQCRLRDVRDMFLDTGIGGEGYAIIDQGGVEFVLSAAPETRRDLFEEAAGVSKYKAKRDEAQRKLEKVDSDLARLMDSVVLIDQQIKKLDTEAKKAKKYQKYKEELSEAEIALALDTVKRHAAALEACAQRLQPLMQEMEGKNARLSVLEGDVATLNLNLTHKQDEFSKYGEKIAGIKYRIGILEGNIRNCDNLSAELVRQIENSRQEDEVSAVRMAQLGPAITRLRGELALLAEQIAPLQARFNEKAGQINAANEELADVERDNEKASTDILRAAQREMECSNKIALEESNLSHSARDIGESEKEFERVTAEREEASAVVARLEGDVKTQAGVVESVRAELAALETERAAVISRRTELNDTVSSVRSRQAALNATMQIIKSQGEKDPYWVGTKTVSESGINGVRGPLRRFLKINPADTLFAEDALGKYLDSVVCDDFNAVDAAVELLRGHGGARCRFLVLSALSADGGKNADPAVLKRIGCAAEYELLLKNLLSGVAVNGTTVTDGFWVVGGADGVESPEPYWAKEEEVRLELTTAGKSFTTLSAELEENRGALARAEEGLAALRGRLNSEMVKGNSLEHELNQARRRLTSAAEALDRLGFARRKFSEQEARQRETIEKLKTELERLRGEQARIRQEGEELKVRRAHAQTALAALKNEQDALNAELYEYKIRRSSLESDLKGVELEHNSAAENSAQRAGRRTEAETRIDELSRSRAGAETELAQTRDQLAELEISENTLREQLTDLKREYAEKGQMAYSLRGETTELQLKSHEVEMEYRSHQTQRDAAVEELRERHNTTVEEAAMKYSDFKIDHERIKMMRRQIENMGAVNMTAPEEYDALSARYEFLKTQINDLETAKRDLRTAIGRINATTKESFRVTFDKVRESFRRIYQTLFEGGEADLLLTDPENLLETGIEIVAQPPGKRLQNIRALSGGEKALTALSLLFSFFVVNPSPFCIMDEADAPLDEANVERYVNLLREFATQTQFIVITHNKRTMEAADRLYGVTMQESGVSKIMSVSLQFAEQALAEEAKTPAAA